MNTLPDTWARPVTVVMQAGHFSAVPVTSTLALVAGRRPMAKRLAVAGTASWLACRAGKALVRRGRPGEVVDAVVVRGRVWTGAGFPSGHAAVATSLAIVAADELGPLAGTGALALAAAVGSARCYVGAHLPNDVVGGAALAVVVARVTEALLPDRAC